VRGTTDQLPFWLEKAVDGSRSSSNSPKRPVAAAWPVTVGRARLQRLHVATREESERLSQDCHFIVALVEDVETCGRICAVMTGWATGFCSDATLIYVNAYPP
jgi:hypothetical protein